MSIKIFKSFEEEQDAKWQQMADSTVQERFETLFRLQRIAFPEAFDPITGKRKPLEHRLTIKKIER